MYNAKEAIIFLVLLKETLGLARLVKNLYNPSKCIDSASQLYAVHRY